MTRCEKGVLSEGKRGGDHSGAQRFLDQGEALENGQTPDFEIT